MSHLVCDLEPRKMTTSNGMTALNTTEYRHMPLDHERTSIRLVRVWSHLSADGLIQCKTRKHVFPETYSEHIAGKSIDNSMRLQ